MPFSRSRSIESMTRSPTSWFSRNAPDCQSIWSTSVVLPWSTWATMATLRRSARVCTGGSFRGSGRTGSGRTSLRRRWPRAATGRTLDLRMDIHEALYTTRAMRRVRHRARSPRTCRPRILDAAIRAPSGGNTQNWRFLLVDDPEVKARHRAAVPRQHRAAVGDGLRRAPGGGGGRSRRPARAPRSAEGEALGPVPRRPLRGGTRSSCSGSCSTTRPVARSTRRCGAPCWPPGPRAWAAR